jgi:hypothetical protein
MDRQDFPDISGAVLVAPAVWGWRVMNPALAGLLRLLAHSAPWLPISASEFRKLASDNQAMLRALDQDPLVLQSVRVDALYGLVTLMDDALESATSLRTPTLILYGARERIIPRAAREKFISHLQASQPVLIYPHGHHTLLRDLNAGVVLRDVARWIGDISMPRSGQVAERRSDEQELSDRRGPHHLHHGEVAARSANHGDAAQNYRDCHREDQGEEADLRNHAWPLCRRGVRTGDASRDQRLSLRRGSSAAETIQPPSSAIQQLEGQERGAPAVGRSQLRMQE